MSKKLLFTTFAVLLLLISCEKEQEDYSIPVDGDGNTYQTIVIGTQTWMVGNLHTTHLNDGTPIDQDLEWKNANTKPVFCFYEHNVSNEPTYGMLYNWHAVNSGKLAPKGWHVATKEDWLILASHFGGQNKAGGAFKALSIWREPNTGATNSSGLGLLPTGWRWGEPELNGIFEGQGEFGHWWTSTPALGGAGGEMMKLSYNSEELGGNSSGPDLGYAVLCVKD